MTTASRLGLILTNKISPPRVMVIGPPGVGKTTFAANAPNPVFILCEDGLGDLSVKHFPLAKKFEDVTQAMDILLKEDHEFQTLVLDSLDWLQELIFDFVCREHNVESIEDANGGYGKGYIEAMRHWRKLLELINTLRGKKNMGVVFTAHTEVRKIQDPRLPAYDTHAIKLNKRSSAVVEEYCDVILFACWDIVVRQEKEGGQKRSRALEEAPRIMHTDLSPQYTAKNRYNLPSTLPFSWKAFADALKKSRGNK